MIEIGDTVRVIRTHDLCCGVLMQGNKSRVAGLRFIPQWGTAVLLEDGSLHWIQDLEKVEV